MTCGWGFGMRSRGESALLRLPALLFLPLFASAGELPYFQVLARDAGSWPQIFSSIGFQAQAAAKAHVFVARPERRARATWAGRVEKGAILVLEGESPLAESFGFKRGGKTVRHYQLARRASADAADHLGKGAGTSSDGLAGGRDSLRARTLDQRADDRGHPTRRGRGAVDGGGSWASADTSDSLTCSTRCRSGTGSAVSGVAALGLLRFLLPLARGPRLFCGALAKVRHRGAACGGVALLRTGPGARSNICKR